MAENWYIVLELEFDPEPIEDIDIINERIEEKAKFWSSKFNDFNKGPQYRKYHQMVPQIKEMMADPEERKRMIKEARLLVYEPIDKLLVKVEKNGEVSEDAIEKIAIKQKVSADIVTKRATTHGFSISVSQNENYRKCYDQYYKIKPKYSVVYDSMNQLLEAFNAKNFYEFLFDDISEKVAANLPVETLLTKAKERKTKDFYKNDSISSSGSKLCWGCEMAFKDNDSKKIYDLYLEHNKIREVLCEIKEIYEIVGELTIEQFEQFSDRLVDAIKDIKVAENIMISFCKIEHIPMPVTATQMSSRRDIKVCRCGIVNDVSDGRKVCRSCGAKLVITCPECGIDNSTDVKVCKCGFKFENYDKAMAFCDLSEKMIGTMEFEAASAYLTEAERYWKNNERVNTLKERIASLELLVGKSFRMMKEACTNKEYYKAAKLCDNIKRLFPEFVDDKIESEIYMSIDLAETYYENANQSDSEEKKVEYFEKAKEVCSDCVQVNEMVLKNLPLPAANVKVEVDNEKKVNTITWEPSEAIGTIRYIVVKKLDVVPSSVDDGEVVGQVSMCCIKDEDLNAGEYYYYAVFAKRAGVYSKAAYIEEPVINLFEVSNVSVETGDTYLQFRWGKLPRGSVIRIFRILEEGEEEILCDNDLCCFDRNLENNVEYTYKICLEYSLYSEKYLTQGIKVTATPVKPPKHVEYLNITPLREGQFKAEWENVGNRNVQFYYSEIKPSYKLGQKVMLNDIESNMKKLIVARSSDSEGVFKYDGNDMIYVIACMIKAGVAITGAIAIAGKGEYVDIKNISVFDRRIKIDIVPPKNVTGFIVLYEFDKFPENIDKVDVKRKYIPYKQYQKDGALFIRECSPKNYYFTVFAEFTKDGQKEYSVGTNCLLTLAQKTFITYSVAMNKKVFGVSSVVLEFTADCYKFDFPDMDIVLAVGQEPKTSKSGVVVYTVRKQTVAGKLRVVMPIERSLDKNTYIKAFLRDETMQTKYQVSLITDCKVC